MTLDYLTLLDRDHAAFRDCLDGDLSAPVEHCGDWTLRDLAGHLGQGNLWSAAAIREKRGDYAPPIPDGDPRDWFAESVRVLTEALHTAPETEAWTFAPPHTVAFWRRRRCLETLVHRWDAEHALGRTSTLDPELCGDGIAEVIEIFVPRMVKRGLATAPTGAVRLTATDLGTSWALGPGEPVATLGGTAAELLLALWSRGPLPWATLTGDESRAREILRGPLTS
ncbi:maleylpyruvate isomerase family mycothiol-dependent enzyme [Actinoplanes sp. NPDC051851]|uniref:maleylpyruvate isomerase family mycothiol-dependent enzyme n=1 Tax=Actinoplanes sp. NPDC051851 TaxID=3154753 RepID=UPI0034467995